MTADAPADAADPAALADPTADLHFWFDPVCPFAWMTSKWVRTVARQRDYRVDWRPISLRLLNAKVDYAAQFPPEYEASHTAGLHLLRVAVQTRRDHGPEGVARFYEACGAAVFEREPGEPVAALLAGGAWLGDVLAGAGLPRTLAVALGDPSLDEVSRAETDRALALTGRDVGTPVLHFEPPAGVAFFGPVISRLPDEAQAARLWDHVVGLAGFPGFAELKRSLRELPQLPSLGVTPGEAGRQEDWHGGSRRQHR